jgi:hypothetical protein
LSQAAVGDGENYTIHFSPSFGKERKLKLIQWTGCVVCMDEQISRESNFIQGLPKVGLTAEQSHLRNE